jgi:hypothetical protein
MTLKELETACFEGREVFFIRMRMNSGKCSLSVEKIKLGSITKQCRQTISLGKPYSYANELEIRDHLEHESYTSERFNTYSLCRLFLTEDDAAKAVEDHITGKRRLSL